jgi:acetyl esterase/lipase
MRSLVFIVHFVITLAVVFWLTRQKLLPKALLGKSVAGACVLSFGILLFELTIFKASNPLDRFHDFWSVYYPAGEAALHNDSASLRDLIAGGVSGFVNMPVIAYLFAPFALFPTSLAFALFSVIGLALTVATWLLLVRMAGLELRERWLLAILFLANGPLVDGVKLGNTSYLVLFALAAGLAMLRAERSVAAGALLGTAALLKPTLLVFGAFFLLRRDVRGVLGFALVCATISALSLLLFGWADNWYWFQTAILQYNNNVLAAFSNQSIAAFLYRLHASPDILLDWLPHKPDRSEKFAAQVLTGLLFLVAAAACIKSSRQTAAEQLTNASDRRDLQYLLTICLCLIASPLTWTHYFAWLLIPIAFFLGSRPAFPSSRSARSIGWIAIFLVTPLVITPSVHWPLQVSNAIVSQAYSSFAVSNLLLGGLLWFGLVAWWLAAPIGVSAHLSKLIFRTTGVVVLILLAIYTAFQVTPWPSALLMRRSMDAEGNDLAQMLDKHAPPNIRAHLNEHYDASDADAFLDVFYPSEVENTNGLLPAIVWVHGGAWVAGDKHEIAAYLKVLAARGYAVVGVNYSLAPGRTYPTALRQINTALAYLVRNAERLHINSSRFVLAGDSVGAQMAGQLAAMISTPSYAEEVGIHSAVDRSRLRAVILYCGIFDMDKMRPLQSFNRLLWSNKRTVVWSYLGTKDYMNDPRLAQLSVIGHITAGFPPIFISVGNADPGASHSYELAEIAASQGVTVDSLFFSETHTPPLWHEYQFDLDTDAGKLSLERSVDFLTKQLGP